MKIEQNPFSLYDFLGYFIPGSILTYSIYYLFHLDKYINVFDFITKFNLGGIESYLSFVILSYTLGQFQSFLSSYSIERYCIWHYSYPFRFLMGFSHDGYYNRELHTKLTKFKRLAMASFLLPISIWDFLIYNILGIKYLNNRQLSEEFKSLINYRFKTLIDQFSNDSQTIDISNKDNFLIIYHYTLENTRNHLSKFNNYVALYGFSRSMSLIFVLNFWIITIYQLIIKNNFNLRVILTILLISIFGFIFYLSYCKFSRRYSMEVIMAFLTIQINNPIKA